MLNNIRIKQTTDEIVLNINVQADNTRIIQELEEKLPKLKCPTYRVHFIKRRFFTI